MNSRSLIAGRALGKSVTGLAIVANDDFSARYDLDRIKGVFSRPSHVLYGLSYVGKILVVNSAKGGVATSWMLGEMASRSMAPLALIFNDSNAIMVQAAAFAGIPIMDQFEENVTRVITTGIICRSNQRRS